MLAACASILLLSVTTFLTQDVAAIPFLWILPLSIYLLSFIFCFEMPRFYQRTIYLPLLAIALIAMGTRLWSGGWRLHLVPTIAIFVASLFVCCMVCHGELVRLKPHPRYLTGFYVMVSLGGATGGLFVGLLAPNLFNAYYEFPIGLALCATLAAITVIGHRKAERVIVGLAVCAYVVFLGYATVDKVRGNRVVTRNFYGQLRVLDDDLGEEEARRMLVHGVINHGYQMLDAKYSRRPVSYFCPASGIGRAILTRKDGVPQKVGVLGLGCGTLVSYGRAGDTYRIYEINPQVIELAQTQFTYLKDTPAKLEVVLGDGRLSLEREPSQQFDVLIMDAFSGDSLPVHLLTREAMVTYVRHLKPGGILAVNISNRYLDLRPVIERAAHAFGRIPLIIDNDPDDEDILCLKSRWSLMIDPSARESYAAVLKSGTRPKEDPGFRTWTDDFSNMYKIFR
jgi:SAM-dependent methyltransferase